MHNANTTAAVARLAADIEVYDAHRAAGATAPEAYAATWPLIVAMERLDALDLADNSARFMADLIADITA